MSEKMVKVTLKRTYGIGATLYGPGESVEVPVHLAEALGLTGTQEPVAPAPGVESEPDARRTQAKRAKGRK